MNKKSAKSYVYILALVALLSCLAASVSLSYAAEGVCSRGDILLCEDWERLNAGCPVGAGWGVTQSNCTSYGGGIVSNPLLSTANSKRTLEIYLKAGTRSTIFPEASLTPQQTVTYVRWYAMWSPGFVYNSNINKHLYVMSNSSSGLNWRVPLHMERAPGYTTIARPVFQLYCGYTDYATSQCSGGEKRLYQNIGTPVDIVPGNWYEFEIMVKPDTYGNPFSGELKLWINGVLKAQHTNVSVRKSTDNSPINAVQLAAYYGGAGDVAPQDQQVWYDNIVVGKSYIGPLGESPSPPTSLKVQ